MSEGSNHPREAIWQAMVICAEALHDTAVMGQRRATRASTNRIRTLALDLAALAHAAHYFKRAHHDG